MIITYLILFQTIILGIPIAQAAVIAIGLALVIGGLTFFMEGLMLGLMPLGETIGLKLPQKSKLPVILIFSFILGMGATFAEPAIGVLKAAGSSVKAWDAPLLFLILNKYSNLLVYAVGVGVGCAVVCGMLRFLYNWSLKPFIYFFVIVLSAFSIWAYFDPNMVFLTGLAWDCGGVTTGPVTVPLVLALGIGICRVVGSADSGSAGFGVVTLASVFPVLAVLILGTMFMGSVPKPMNEADFFGPDNRKAASALFNNKEEMYSYAFKNASAKSQIALFDGESGKMIDYMRRLLTDEKERTKIFGEKSDALYKWAAIYGTKEQQLAVFGSIDNAREAVTKYSSASNERIDIFDILKRNTQAAAQAIIPLSIFFLIMLTLVLRERLPRADEILLGLTFAVIGMGLFNIGIELGLSKLGNQVGGKVPSSFKAVELTEQKKTISNFNPEVVQSAVTQEGEKTGFFYVKDNNDYKTLPYHDKQFNPDTKQYTYIPTKGPLFGGIIGIVVVLIFAFILGYGATLAEPALNALGLTVEELTVGAFKKSLLMQTVALGVGFGIAIGVAKIIWNLPLVWMLAPPYFLLIFITKISTEEFVNIGWDSAGVTTGPITVPLVLAMGLGISGQVGVVEGFGILAMASVCPILAVLCVGLSVTKKRKAALKEVEQSTQKEVAA
ncbi:MAG: DUF1538 domain-containing protein [bacterium]